MFNKSRYLMPLAAAFLFLGLSSVTILAADKPYKPDLLDIQNQVDEIEPILKDANVGLEAVRGKLDGLFDHAATNKNDSDRLLSGLADDVNLVKDQITSFENSMLDTLDAMSGSRMSSGEFKVTIPFDAVDSSQHQRFSIDVGDVPKKLSVWVSEDLKRWERRSNEHLNQFDQFTIVVYIWNKAWGVRNFWTQEGGAIPWGTEEDYVYRKETYHYGLWQMMNFVPVMGEVKFTVLRNRTGISQDTDEVVIRWMLED